MSDKQGVWVYAITDRGDSEDLSWLVGVADGRVRTAAAADLTAVVSDVDLAEFGEEALRANLEDLAWLGKVARAHHYVIDAAGRLFPVVPARFATVYRGDATMAAALGERRGQLRDMLRRVGGRVEWGVKAYPVSPEADGDCPAAVGGGAVTRQGGAGAGMAYLRRRRDELSAREDARQTAAEGVRAVHEELSGRALRTQLHPPRVPALSGRRTPTLLNAAYLVEAGAEADFRTVVAAAARAHPELRLDLSGPWPPYSFTMQDR